MYYGIKFFLRLIISLSAVPESCPGQMVEITGRAGLFLQGQVTPELEGVEITIRKSGDAESLITVLTDISGSYRY